MPAGPAPDVQSSIVPGDVCRHDDFGDHGARLPSESGFSVTESRIRGSPGTVVRVYLFQV